MKRFTLDNHPKITTGFNLPADSYFEKLSETISKKIELTKPKILPLYRRKIVWFSGIAAILMIGLFISVFEQKTHQDSFSAEDFVVTDNSISTDEIAEQLTEDDIVALEKKLIIHDQETIDEIENFL